MIYTIVMKKYASSQSTNTCYGIVLSCAYADKKAAEKALKSNEKHLLNDVGCCKSAEIRMGGNNVEYVYVKGNELYKIEFNEMSLHTPGEN